MEEVWLPTTLPTSCLGLGFFPPTLIRGRPSTLLRMPSTSLPNTSSSSNISPPPLNFSSSISLLPLFFSFSFFPYVFNTSFLASLLSEHLITQCSMPPSSSPHISHFISLSLSLS
eukprot:Lithocolla_globosa_v1_NODE_10853_length_560_cov_1.641584.p2 type:complete len:115 gc:universal NODE_10853_length_560_cov_1.641584:95-439(+)